MKWKRKGHEYDDFAGSLLLNYREKKKRIYIFGAGTTGYSLKELLDFYQCFNGFIDNSEEKQAAGADGTEILSLGSYLRQKKEGLIVIAADGKNIPVIAEQLRGAGLEERKDFWRYPEFMQEVFPILSLYEYDKLYAEMVQLSLTERCTLKCKKCAHACCNVPMNAGDMNMETALESADTLFGRIDMVKEFTLIGGEPFLYQDLARIIEYIGEKYRDQIINFSITTNGTMLPSQKVLEMCRKYGVLIRISDYSAALPRLEAQYKKLCRALEENKVSYLFGWGKKETVWMDYGFETVDRKGEEKELLSVFDGCRTPCREIRGSRLHFCIMARSVSDNLNLGVGMDDYLDLKETDDKKMILEYLMGYSDKGYLDMCNFCYGAEAVEHSIPAAEQRQEKGKICRGLV